VRSTSCLAMGRVLQRSVLVVVAVALAACGSTTSESSTTTSTIRDPPSSESAAPRCGVIPSAEVVVSAGTEPCTVVMHPGASARIALSRGFTWNDPTSDTSTVRVSSVRRPADGGLQAEMVAVRAGRATVTASGGVACDPGTVCPALARVWTVFVEVR